jgi:hypothetical protein
VNFVSGHNTTPLGLVPPQRKLGEFAGGTSCAEAARLREANSTPATSNTSKWTGGDPFFCDFETPFETGTDSSDLDNMDTFKSFKRIVFPATETAIDGLLLS